MNKIKWYLPILGLYYYPKAMASRKQEIEVMSHFFTTAMSHAIYLAIPFLYMLFKNS